MRRRAETAAMLGYFGVTPAQSALSGLPVYDIGAGFKRVDATASVTYALTEHGLVRGQGGLGYLVGDAADSPIVQDKVQPSGILAVGCRFQHQARGGRPPALTRARRGSARFRPVPCSCASRGRVR